MSKNKPAKLKKGIKKDYGGWTFHFTDLKINPNHPKDCIYCAYLSRKK